MCLQYIPHCNAHSIALCHSMKQRSPTSIFPRVQRDRSARISGSSSSCSSSSGNEPPLKNTVSPKCHHKCIHNVAPPPPPPPPKAMHLVPFGYISSGRLRRARGTGCRRDSSFEGKNLRLCDGHWETAAPAYLLMLLSLGEPHRAGRAQGKRSGPNARGAVVAEFPLVLQTLMQEGHGGCDSSVLDTNYPPPPPPTNNRYAVFRIPGPDQAVRGGCHGQKLHSGSPPGAGGAAAVRMPAVVWLPTVVRMPAVLRTPACHSRRFKGQRPIGTAQGKQSDTEALCQTPPLTVGWRLPWGGEGDSWRPGTRRGAGAPQQCFLPAFGPDTAGHMRGSKTEEAPQWADWLHTSCRLGGPQRFKAGETIRSGPPVSALAVWATMAKQPRNAKKRGGGQKRK